MKWIIRMLEDLRYWVGMKIYDLDETEVICVISPREALQFWKIYGKYPDWLGGLIWWKYRR